MLLYLKAYLINRWLGKDNFTFINNVKTLKSQFMLLCFLNLLQKWRRELGYSFKIQFLNNSKLIIKITINNTKTLCLCKFKYGFWLQMRNETYPDIILLLNIYYKDG